MPLERRIIYPLPGRHGANSYGECRCETDVQDPEKFAEIVVRQEGDKRVRLGDVAEVELASDTYESAAYSSGEETVFIAITEAPGANPLEVAARVKNRVKEIETQLPADMTIFWIQICRYPFERGLRKLEKH